MSALRKSSVDHEYPVAAKSVKPVLSLVAAKVPVTPVAEAEAAPKGGTLKNMLLFLSAPFVGLRLRGPAALRRARSCWRGSAARRCSNKPRRARAGLREVHAEAGRHALRRPGLHPRLSVRRPGHARLVRRQRRCWLPHRRRDTRESLETHSSEDSMSLSLIPGVTIEPATPPHQPSGPCCGAGVFTAGHRPPMPPTPRTPSCRKRTGLPRMPCQARPRKDAGQRREAFAGDPGQGLCRSRCTTPAAAKVAIPRSTWRATARNPRPSPASAPIRSSGWKPAATATRRPSSSTRTACTRRWCARGSEKAPLCSDCHNPHATRSAKEKSGGRRRAGGLPEMPPGHRQGLRRKRARPLRRRGAGVQGLPPDPRRQGGIARPEHEGPVHCPATRTCPPRMRSGCPTPSGTWRPFPARPAIRRAPRAGST